MMKLEYGTVVLESKDYDNIKARLSDGKSMQAAFEIELAENGISILDVFMI